MGICGLSAEQLATQLDELGFVNVTGSYEYPGGKTSNPELVAHCRPLRWGSNNGVIGVTDDFGHVWIARQKLLEVENFARFQVDILVTFESGLWVPHSNGCDRERCKICEGMFQRQVN